MKTIPDHDLFDSLAILKWCSLGSGCPSQHCSSEQPLSDAALQLPRTWRSVFCFWLIGIALGIILILKWEKRLSATDPEIIIVSCLRFLCQYSTKPGLILTKALSGPAAGSNPSAATSRSSGHLDNFR